MILSTRTGQVHVYSYVEVIRTDNVMRINRISEPFNSIISLKLSWVSGGHIGMLVIWDETRNVDNVSHVTSVNKNARY